MIEALLLLVFALIVYFLFGIALKFFIGWFPLIIGIPPLLIYGLSSGLFSGLIVLAIISVLIHLTNEWHNSDIYLKLESSIDKRFNLSD